MIRLNCFVTCKDFKCDLFGNRLYSHNFNVVK